MLIYDGETTLLKAHTFRTGKQVITHKQLDKSRYKYDMICLSYQFSSDIRSYTLDWGRGSSNDSDKMIKEFNEIIREAQDNNIVIIGKNNKRFDDKHLNTHRWLNGDKPMPDWGAFTDDLESQLRKYFYLPSYSLDYVSELKGLGGKNKMELQDWINIQDMKQYLQIVDEVGPISNALEQIIWGRHIDLKECNRSFDNMIKYCPKDVKDTLAIIKDVAKYCDFKSTAMPRHQGDLYCKYCHGHNVKLNGNRIIKGVMYKALYCNECNHSCGRARVGKDGKLGKII